VVEPVSSTMSKPAGNQEFSSLLDEWTEMISCPNRPVPGWQFVAGMVSQLLYRASHNRPLYAEDFHETVEMLTTAGIWRVENQGDDPYADWRARVLPLFIRTAQGLPRRPAGHLAALTVGQRIRLRREASGLTQDQLGRRIGVRFETVSRWERDLIPPRRRYRQLLAEELGGHESEYNQEGEL